MNAFYPVYLDLRNQQTLVIGGNAEAEKKVVGLLEAGARVRVVSPSVTTSLARLIEDRGVAWIDRSYRAGDLRGVFLAISCLVDPAFNAPIWEEAQQEKVLLNAMDDVPHCHFIAPSIHRSGDLTVAISTAGKGPALAVRLRQKLAEIVGPEYGRFLELMGDLREEVADRLPAFEPRRALWYRIVDSNALELVRMGDMAGARRLVGRLLREAFESSDQTDPEPSGTDALVNDRPDISCAREGFVHLVGAGPGDADLITVRGKRILERSQAVVYDDLVDSRVLNLAPSSAERIALGKHRRPPQAEINALLVKLAKRGLQVTRLKCGDPFVFGRGAEEGEALAEAGVPFDVVPGLTSAITVPAAAGIPVTHRDHASSFTVVTGHECEGPSDLDWGALARMRTLIVLMGLGSLGRICQRLQREGASAETPVAVISSGTLPDEKIVVGSLASITDLVASSPIARPAVIVIGDVVRVREALSAVGAVTDSVPSIRGRACAASTTGR